MISWDSNYWGVLALPVGLVFCFGPALFVWVILEARSGSSKDDKDE